VGHVLMQVLLLRGKIGPRLLLVTNRKLDMRMLGLRGLKTLSYL